MTDLSGINLRKELCFELGWKLICDSAGFTLLLNPEGHVQSGSLFGPPSEMGLDVIAFGAPAWESDATLFFGLLDKVCKEREWDWVMWRDANDLCGCAILQKADRLQIASNVHEDVPAAGARCLLSALKADTRKEK